MIEKDLTLQEIWKKHGRSRYYTDKGDGHSYLEAYDLLFKELKHSPVKLLEIGHSAGGALRLFDDFFTHPDAKILGIDVSDNDWLTMYGGKPYDTPRVKTYLQNVLEMDPLWFKRLDFIPDIVIEDSDHQLTTQLFIVNLIWPLLPSGGMLIIEDVLDPLERQEEFKKLGIPFQLVDFNPIQYTRDNALIIYHKE